MGAFFGSVQVRTVERAAVKSAVELVVQQRSIKCLVGPEINGWVGIYPEGNGQDDSVGHAIAQQLCSDVLQMVVHDDDTLAYWLWRDHKLVDSYQSNPGIFGDDDQEGDNHRGDPEQFRLTIGDKANRLAAVLNQDKKYSFETERLTVLAKVLGIVNAATAFEYLEGGERTGIKGWRKFEFVPPKVREPSTKRATAKSLRSKLRAAGLLLYSEEWKDFSTIGVGCAFEEGFVFGWSDFLNGKHETGVHVPPWNVARSSPVESSSHLTELSSDAGGRLSMIRTGESIRVVDVAKILREISEIEYLRGAIVSPRRDLLAYAAAQHVTVAEVGTGRRLYTFAQRNPRELAVHPSGKWVVASGDCLRIACLDGEPHTRDVYVGGHSRVTIANIIGNEEPGCVGFSGDGHFFWCGTNVGLRIYEWETLASQSTQKPRWQIRLHDQLPSFFHKQITAVAEERGGDCIVFGTFAGKLARFDLQTGELFKLVDLPTGGKVEKILFSADGRTLAVYSDYSVKVGPKHTRAWEIFDYRRLRDVGIAVGRAEKPGMP